MRAQEMSVELLCLRGHYVRFPNENSSCLEKLSAIDIASKCRSMSILNGGACCKWKVNDEVTAMCFALKKVATEANVTLTGRHELTFLTSARSAPSFPQHSQIQEVSNNHTAPILLLLLVMFSNIACIIRLLLR
jgi:hypothetical protein